MCSKADPLDVVAGAFEVAAFFAVELDEGAAVFRDFVVVLDLWKNWATWS